MARRPEKQSPHKLIELQRIGEVRRAQGVSSRLLKRRLLAQGFPLRDSEVRALDDPENDIDLRLLYAVAHALGVPPCELVDSGDTLGNAPYVQERANLLRAMKTARSLEEAAQNNSPANRGKVRQYGLMFLRQMLESFPHLASEVPHNILEEIRRENAPASNDTDGDQDED